MDNTYPSLNEVEKGDKQSNRQLTKETVVNDYPSRMYNSLQATTSRYSVQDSQIITAINTPIGFAPPVSRFPDTTQRAIVAAENQKQL